MSLLDREALAECLVRTFGSMRAAALEGCPEGCLLVGWLLDEEELP